MLKPILLMITALAALVVIVFFSALFWIKSSDGLQWVQARINASIPGKIAIEEHQLSLIRPSLDLHGVVLFDPQGHNLAGFRHLGIELDWWALLRREIRLELILLENPWADLAVDEAGGLNLMTALVPPGRGEETDESTQAGIDLPFNIVFPSVQLIDGRLSFTSPVDATRLETTGIALSADGNLMTRSASLDLTLDHVRFNSTGIHLQPARIDLKAHFDNDRLSIPAMVITSGQTTLKLSGSADGLTTTPTIDSVLSVDSQLAELKTLLDLAGDYSGPLTAKLALKGTVANPDAELVLMVDNNRIADQQLDHGNITIRLKDRQVTIDTATFQLADGTVNMEGTVNLREAFPEGFLDLPADTGAIAYALTLVEDIPDLNPWLNRFVDINGRMNSRLSLSGKGVTPAGISAELTLDGSGSDLRAPGMDRPVACEVNLSAQMNQGKMSISSLDIATDGVVISGSGHFQLDNQALGGNLSLAADDLSRVLAVVGFPSVNGTCNAELTLDGHLKQPQFSVDLAATNLKIDAYALGDLAIAAGMDHDGQLTVQNLTLQNQDSRLQGKGHTRLLPNGGGVDPGFTNDLDLTFEMLSAANFMESPPMDGTVDGRLQLNGQLTSLKGELSLNASGLGVDAATIGDVYTRMRLDDGILFVDRFHLLNQDSTLNAAGRIQFLVPNTLSLNQDPTFDVTVDSDHLDPGDFIDAISGDFTLDGVLSGSVEKPVGRITLTGTQANVAGQAIETISLDARFEERRLWLDRLLAAVVPGEQIEGSGSVGLDKTVDLNVKSGGISVSHIPRLHDLFPGEGLLHVDVSAQGNMENPDIDGKLTISDIVINDGAIEDVNLSFSLHDMLAKVTGNLNFDMDATCDLKMGDFDARLTFDQTETNSYFKAAGKPDFHGTLTGQVQAAGNIRDAANTEAQVDLSELHLLFKDVSLVQSERIVLKLADQELSIPEFEVALLSSGNLRLQGNARLGGRLNMEIAGRIPLDAAKVLSDELPEAEGFLIVDGKVSGVTTDPQMNARIDLENLGMMVPGLEQKLHNLNGSIHLTPDSIRIDDLSGRLDTGSFNVGGTVGHEKFTPRRMDLSVGMRSLPIEVPDALALLLNGDIKITGNEHAANVNGNILLLEGTYFKDVKISLMQVATTRQRRVPPAAKPVSIPYFDTVNLNISIGHRQPFAVENNMADLEISPVLKIGGTLALPIVSGRADVKEGTVNFQDKTFDVKKGVIYFANPYKTEAEIDIVSEAEIRTWKIYLAAKGTPENLDITLTSEPTETEADILSLMLFGRTTRELTAGEGGAKLTTTQIMAEMIADTFGDDIKKSTGVDILQVETTDGDDGEDAGGVKVTMGKHLSERVTVKYAIETKDGDIIQRAITEYKLLEHILVSGFQDTKGVYGSELMYRIEFR